MELEWRIAVVVAALVVGTVVWLAVQRGRGVLKPTAAEAGLPMAVAHLAGERLTLVQVSSEYCTSCVRGARIWRDAIADQPGIGFAEIDAADHMDMVRELGILTTPTTLVYDDGGLLRGRVAGAPTPRAAAAVLAPEQDGVLR